MIRLFVAIAAPHGMAAAVAPLSQGLPGARWSPEENLHITLRFIGEVSETVAEDVDSALSVVTGAPFDLTLAGVGAFGGERGVEAIWAGVGDDDALRIVQGRCERAVRRAGVKPDTRLWKPHVTLAYLNGADTARVGAWTQTHNLFRSRPFRVDRFGLYSSWRTRRGSAYRLERTYALTAPPRGP